MHMSFESKTFESSSHIYSISTVSTLKLLTDLTLSPSVSLSVSFSLFPCGGGLPHLSSLLFFTVVHGCGGSTVSDNFILGQCQYFVHAIAHTYTHTSCVGDSAPRQRQEVRQSFALHAGSVGVWGCVTSYFSFCLKTCATVLLNVQNESRRSSCGLSSS